MPAPTPAVDVVLGALADPTRRAVFEDVLRSGPVTATTLAADRSITRQAVTKHLERLAEAGLARSERAGRETLWSADPAPLNVAMDWMATVGDAWDQRLGRLAKRFGKPAEGPERPAAAKEQPEREARGPAHTRPNRAGPKKTSG